MRFIEDGPDIPDELLDKLDEGKVMFFCGAGVSRAYANLPNFIKLAEEVLEKLRILDDDPADQILKLARNDPEKKTKTTEKQINVSDFVSSDIIFSELEKDFDAHDIEIAVAKALNPPKGTRLKAHKIMLDLSTTQDGRTRLVTTNFDRLFEKCDSSLKAWQPPKLPDSNEIGLFQGVVYLHGAARKKYNGSDSRFILSSAEFGRAYLAEGWATQFFKQIVSKYTVIFVGYSADDPLIRYLLEALNKSGDKPNKIYAFHSGTQEQAKKKWKNKGVTPIAYDSKDKHAQLWQTLDKWATRTKDIKAWQDRIIKMARKGPRQLSPFQREQVVQLVLMKDGAQRFSESKNPPPASWLCVFDRTIRFERPYPMVQDDGTPFSLDLFPRYKLDSDIEPEPIKPNDYLANRHIPDEALDAFVINERDKNETQTNPVIPMRSEAALSAGILPTRLGFLGEWIAKISNQNITVWWVARQSGIHPWVQERIKYALEDETNCPDHILHAWQYVFDNWTPKADDRSSNNLEWHWFRKNSEQFGWGEPTIRRYEQLTKPRLVTKSRFLPSAIARPKKKINFKHLIEMTISYNDPPDDIKIPDDALAQIVAVWRRNIEKVMCLEAEKGYQTMINRPLITQNPQREQSYDLVDIVLYYTFFLNRLLEFKPRQAQIEIKFWDNKNHDIYNYLRIWSFQFPKLVPNAKLAQNFSAMDGASFWYAPYEHDLLHVLKARWSDMSLATKRAIEKRILLGREKDKGEKQDEYIKNKTELTLMRLDWLKDKGCNLSVATETQMARLKNTTPTYTPEHVKYVDRSEDGQARPIHMNNDPSALLGLPPSDILPKAQELMGWKGYPPEYKNPFVGLCEANPALALSALGYEATRGKFRTWAWRAFLQSKKRKDDTSSTKKLIAEYIILMSDEPGIEIIYASAYWLKSASKNLPSACVPVFEQLTKWLIKVLHKNHEDEDLTMKSRETARDWGTEAFNRPAGYIAQVLFNDPRIEGLEAKETFPRAWLDIVESMLALPDDQGRWALLFFAHNLRWLYKIDPRWTDDKILQPLRDGNPDTLEAWWEGYIHKGEQPIVPPLFAKIKPHLLTQASHQNFQKRNSSTIIKLILLNWHHKSKNKIAHHILDDDIHRILRDAGDGFRVRFLRMLQEHCKEEGTKHRRWKNKRSHLIKNVWPLQKYVKTVGTSNGLIEFVFSDEQAFPRMSKTIIPLLGKIKEGHVMFLERKIDDAIINKYPETVLEILYRVFPQTLEMQFPQIGKTLNRITTASPKLKRDPRLTELQRRYSAR